MSILLDALKKSEEQRRLGQTPSIHSGDRPAQPDRPARSAWISASMAVIALGVMIWFGLEQYDQPAGSGTVNENASAQPSAGELAGAPADTGQQERAAVTENAAGMQDRERARTPVESFSSPRPDPAVAAGPAAAAESPNEGLAGAVAGFEPPNDELSEGTSADVSVDAVRDTRDVAAALVPAEPAASRSQQPSGRTEPGSESESRARNSAPISYWALPQGIRNELPDLRITVMVYAADPSARFILVNGQRLVEGDPLQEGLVLREVRREGAIFTYRNYRFLVDG
jgi:general secretion pathway protein B